MKYAQWVKSQPKQSKWVQRLDSTIAALAPAYATKRMVSREKMNRFRYLSAQQTEDRRNSSQFTASGETQLGDRERKIMNWNAVELIENSGLASSIRNKFINYICGTLRYQSRTGDRVVNDEYEHYLQARFGKCFDITGNNTMRQMAGLVVGGLVVKGDCVLHPIRMEDTLYWQGIEADRIGNPLEYMVRDDFIGGCHLDFTGRKIAMDIYRRQRLSGQYFYERTEPTFNDAGLPNMLFTYNRNTFDDVRGRTVFKSVIDNIHYLRQIRDYELAALSWAASQSGIYHTKSGELPSDLPFDKLPDEFDFDGNAISRFRVTPNTVQAIGVGEDVTMFQHDRPSPNVIALWRDTVREIAKGVDLSFGLVWDMSGISGPAVRADASHDKRALTSWKMNLTEDILRPVAIMELGNGIANGEIPYHPRWMNGEYQFPAHPTIDAGRESAADISEYAANLTSGADICAEESRDVEEVIEQCGAEAQARIQEAKRIAKEEGIDDWREVLSYSAPGKNIIMAPEFEAARAAQLEQQISTAKKNEDNATTNGTELP